MTDRLLCSKDVKMWSKKRRIKLEALSVTYIKSTIKQLTTFDQVECTGNNSSHGIGERTYLLMDFCLNAFGLDPSLVLYTWKVSIFVVVNENVC